jgi:hypothetical protein
MKNIPTKIIKTKISIINNLSNHPRLKKRNYFVETPNMIANRCFHRWRNAQRLMNPAEIVVHIMKRDCVLRVFQLFREGIGQPGKPAHRHSHREVLTFNVARGDMVVIESAADNGLASTHAIVAQTANGEPSANGKNVLRLLLVDWAD